MSANSQQLFKLNGRIALVTATTCLRRLNSDPRGCSVKLGLVYAANAFLVSLPVGPYGVLALIMLGYLILGAVMDELAMILLTVPIVFPAMMHLGFDPVWFGVIVVMAVTLGMICPPVGMNVFVINSIARDVPLGKIYKGTMPFIAVDLIRLVILCAFPAISLWLPGYVQ